MSDQIEIILEGLSEDDGDTRLEVFVAQLQSILRALKALDKEVFKSEGGNSYFKVANLTHSSPATITLEAAGIDAPHQAILLERFGGIMDSVIKNGGDVPEHLASPEVLEPLSKFTSRTTSKLESASIRFRGNNYNFTPEKRKNIRNAIREQIPIDEFIHAITSYEGKLDAINVHDNANVFDIFPLTGPAKIRCYFPERLHNEAISAIGRKVFVKGKGKYKRNENFPCEIKVEHMKLYEYNKNLPTFRDLRGKEPNITGEKSAVEFVRDIRDEWD